MSSVAPVGRGHVGLGLPIVDATGLDAERRAAFRPDEEVRCDDGGSVRLPRWFYEVESWELARATRVTEHFTLHEFMAVDVREAEAARRWPRYVPLAVTLLAPHLELLRRAAGTLVWISANGGYRSPSHARTHPGSPHCQGTAADVYRIGDEYLESEDAIRRWSETLRSLCPALRVGPFGHGGGGTDDHLHADVGYVRVVPHPDAAGRGGGGHGGS